MKIDGNCLVFQNFLQVSSCVYSFTVASMKSELHECTFLLRKEISMFLMVFILKEELWETEWYLLNHLPKKKYSGPTKEKYFFPEYAVLKQPILKLSNFFRFKIVMTSNYVWKKGRKQSARVRLDQRFPKFFWSGTICGQRTINAHHPCFRKTQSTKYHSIKSLENQIWHKFDMNKMAVMNCNGHFQNLTKQVHKNSRI